MTAPQNWSVYKTATGEFTGRHLLCLMSDLSANLLAGELAMQGQHAAHRFRVDLATGQVVPWQPPAPPDDALRTWAWNATISRWEPVPTAAALAQAVRAERARRLQATDWVRFRALDQGQAVPAQWLAYWQALRDITLQAGFPAQVVWPVPPGEGA